MSDADRLVVALASVTEALEHLGGALAMIGEACGGVARAARVAADDAPDPVYDPGRVDFCDPENW